MKTKQLISAILAAATMLTSTAFAKSDYLIDQNLDRMKWILNAEDFRVFTEAPAEDSVYYGAKFEPRSGILIGTPGNKGFEGIENSINTTYEWFVPSEELTNDKIPREEKAEVPSDHSEIMGWNWNFASQVPVDMSRYENYIKNYIDNLAAMGIDILLIFGKEMNIDDNFLDEQVFIDCYRYVASYAKTKNNIAMVWAPNDTGGLDTRLIDFYPGDEYVDWIGCSLYSMPYFTGNKNATYGDNIAFIMGPYANPVMRAKVIHEFMEENGIKKPVFITEGGIGYESPDGEDFTEWALQQLRKYYGEMIRVYPEFKCIVSFNNYVPDGDYYRYDMGNNPVLLENLQYFMQDPIFIKQYPQTSPISYKQVFDGIDFTGTVRLSAYGYQPTVQWMDVRYIIDGETVCETSYPPYQYETSDLSEGNHRLRVEFSVSGNTVEALEYDFGYKQAPPVVEATPEPITAIMKRLYNNEEYYGGCLFRDMDEMPAEMRNAAAYLAAEGVINGVDENNFCPNDKLTRAALAQMLTKALKLPQGDSTFSDVAEEAWYYDSVSAAKAAGMIDGFDDGTFKPDDYVTNEQLIAVIAKYLNKTEAVPEITLDYTDEISWWAQDFVKTAKSKNIVLPYEDNSFKGAEQITRGDCAVVINRFLMSIK